MCTSTKLPHRAASTCCYSIRFARMFSALTYLAYNHNAHSVGSFFVRNLPK